MLLAAGYFDESTDGEFEERVFTVGGYILSGYPAIQLDLRWRDLLKKYGLAYFKASELEAGIEQFAKFRDNPNDAPIARFTPREKELFKAIKTDFVDLLCAQTDMAGISATVHMQNWKAFAAEYPSEARLIPSAYQLCGQIVMMEAGLLMNATNKENPSHMSGILRPVFDSHQEYSGRFIAGFDAFTKKNPICSRSLLPPLFEDEKSYVCLQAADLYTYEVRRTVSNHFFDPRRDLRIAMKRLFPQAMRTYVIDYDALKLITGWKGDSIPLAPVEKLQAEPIGLIQ